MADGRSPVGYVSPRASTVCSAVGGLASQRFGSSRTGSPARLEPTEPGAARMASAQRSVSSVPAVVPPVAAGAAGSVAAGPRPTSRTSARTPNVSCGRIAASATAQLIGGVSIPGVAATRATGTAEVASAMPCVASRGTGATAVSVTCPPHGLRTASADRDRDDDRPDHDRVRPPATRLEAGRFELRRRGLAATHRVIVARVALTCRRAAAWGRRGAGAARRNPPAS